MSRLYEFFVADPFLAPGDFFGASNLEALAFLNGGDKLPSFKQAVVGAGIEPGIATAHDFDLEFLLLKVDAIDVSNFKFTAGAGFDVPGDVNDARVVEIEAGDGVTGLGLLGLFFDADGALVFVELDDTIAFWIDRGSIEECPEQNVDFTEK